MENRCIEIPRTCQKGSIKTNDEPENTNILENKVTYQLTRSFLDLAVLRQEF